MFPGEFGAELSSGECHYRISLPLSLMTVDCFYDDEDVCNDLSPLIRRCIFIENSCWLQVLMTKQ